VLVLINLNLFIVSLCRVLGRDFINILEGEARELLGRLEETLLKADTDSKLVVNEPDLVNLDDAADALTLFD
jgi:hypothetical protein